MKIGLTLTAVIVLAYSCSDRNNLSDAYGNFEATEILISSESQGKILSFLIEEGLKINAGDTVGYIDTLQYYLQKEQLKSRIDVVQSKMSNIRAQSDVFREQKKTLQVEQERLAKLLEDGAATDQQMDNVVGQIRTIESQITATESQYASVAAEIRSIQTQINQVNDQIRRCFIINPVDGTVLEKYAETYEVTVPGKILYKIADLETMELRIYVSGKQLPHIQLGQTVSVLVDYDEKTNQELTGTISWISEKSEFTPKIIQTKEERVNLVYSVKVQVINDGRLKIGMPGEVNFETTK